MAKLGSLIGALGLVVLFFSGAMGGSMTVGTWILLAGLGLIIVGFFRGETRR